MDAIIRRAKKALRLDIRTLIAQALRNPRIENFIIRKNLEKMFVRGEDALGESLGEYSLFTIRKKIENGQITTHITLKDTGEFYESFKLIVGRDFFEVSAETIKEDGTDLVREFGEDIIGLQAEDFETLIIMVGEELQILFERKILG